MRVADLGGDRSGNRPVGRVTEVPSSDLTIPLALNRMAAFEGCVQAGHGVAHRHNIVSPIRLCPTLTARVRPNGLVGSSPTGSAPCSTTTYGTSGIPDSVTTFFVDANFAWVR